MTGRSTRRAAPPWEGDRAGQANEVTTDQDSREAWVSGPPFDLLVVGGGTAGLVGARTAALLGARVALVERGRLGGDCLNVGCVPSKSLLAAAHRAADVRSGGRLGVHVDGVRVDFGAVMAHVRGAVAAIAPTDSAESLQRAGVAVLRGQAAFAGPDRLLVDGREVPWRRLLLATGSGPAVPPIPGLDQAGALTSDTVWDLRQLPGRLVVLGGGAIGCELGQAFARLGSRVTLIESAPRLLVKEDPDAAALVHAALEADGVQVLTGCTVTRARDGAVVVRGGDGAEREVTCDGVLVAVGRHPGTRGMGLAEAGIELDSVGRVRVDRRLHTTNRRVWAAGDVTALPPFTHTAGVYGSLAATNAVLGLRRRVSLRAVPRVTFTDPEVAAVGAPTWGPSGNRVVTREHRDVDRAVAEGRTEGFARLALGRGSRVVGATVVGPRGGEALAELTLAVREGLSSGDLSGTIHPYPTYGDGPWNAAIDDVRARLAGPVAHAVTRLVVALRRR